MDPVQTTIQDMPDEILLKVMSNVSASAVSPSSLLNLRLVNRRWNKLAVEPVVLRSTSRMGVAIRARQWGPNALRFLENLISHGSLEAMYMLGMILFYCHPDKRTEGSRLIVRAGKEGHAAALFTAAVISFNGSGWGRDSKDMKLGLSLCLRASALGHVEAMREIGHCLSDGFGIKKDQTEGWRFLLMAYMRETVSLYSTSEAAGIRGHCRKRKNGSTAEELSQKRQRGSHGWKEAGNANTSSLSLLDLSCGDRQWDYFGNSQGIPVETQQKYVNDLLHGSKFRFNQLAIHGISECLPASTSNSARYQDDCRSNSASVTMNPLSSATTVHALSASAPRPATLDSATVGNNAPLHRYPKSSAARSLLNESVAAVAAEAGNKEEQLQFVPSCSIGNQPRSIAAQEMLTGGTQKLRREDKFHSDVDLDASSSGEGEESSIHSGNDHFLQVDSGACIGRCTSQESQTQDDDLAGIDLLTVDEILTLVRFIGSNGNAKDILDAVKGLIVRMEGPKPQQTPHPANVFIQEWFSGSFGHKLPDGATFCRRQSCGRPETRLLEFWRCSTCWSARYCSRNCQIYDWESRHSVECFRSALP